MPALHLHLVVDDDLGPALWVRAAVPGGSRAAEDLAPVRSAAPPPLADALAPHPVALRHRVRIPGRGGAADRRVPALPLDADGLAGVVWAVRTLLLARFPEQGDDRLVELAGEGTPIRLAEGLAAMPDLTAAAVLAGEAEALVGARDLRLRTRERFGRTTITWAGPDADRPPLLHALVDALARRAFAAFLDGELGPDGAGDPGLAPRTEVLAAPGDLAGPEDPVATEDDAEPVGSSPGSSVPVPDPLGLLPALAADGELALDLPGRRGLDAALARFTDSGRAVALAATDDALLLRLFEPEPGTTRWLLQTCLREDDGTVHPVDALRAVGDLTAAGAAEAAAAVLQLSPVVRGAAVEPTGVDWMLTTLQAGAFLAEDSPALERAGVTVLLPREWTAQRTTVRPQGAEAEEGARKQGGGVGLAAMASFRWRVSVGDTDLTEDEIAAIREAQSEIVQLRGRWIRLDPATLRAAERFLDTFAARTGGPRTGAAAAARSTRRPGAPAGSRAPDRPVPERADPEGPAPGQDPSVLPVPAAGALPGEVQGSASWADLAALLLSDDAADLALTTEAIAAGGAGGITRLLPGGEGPRALAPPASLQATLRPYQQAGLDWMWALEELGLGGILADDMGLGKTMQVLALLCREREPVLPGGDSPAARPGHGPGQDPGPTLLVCPMSVVGSWQREAARFAPQLRVHVHHGGDRLRDAEFARRAAQSDLVLTTYSLLARDLTLLAGVDWHRLVADEAQYLKTPDTQVTRAARSLRARHRLVLTGTPVENRLGDLHALQEIANPGLLGPLSAFRTRIAEPIEDEGDTGALSRLKFVTAPVVLRRVKTDRSIIPDLPEKTELTRVVTLTPEQAGLYEALVEELMAQVDGADDRQRRSLVVSTLTRLKQVCNHPAHYLGDGSPLLRDGRHRSGKLELVDDLLETALAEGDKALLFTQFTAFGRLLVPHWEERFGRPVPFLHGGVPKPERDAMVADFQERPEEPGLMLLSLRAGGTGLTLTAATHVVHLDRWWNPAVENQATDRAFRIGQRRDVLVHKLVSAGTVEERIDTVLQDKQHLADLTVSPGEDWLADLDDSSLRALLTLSPEDDGRERP